VANGLASADITLMSMALGPLSPAVGIRIPL